jgi:hypothetical protein
LRQIHELDIEALLATKQLLFFDFIPAHLPIIASMPPSVATSLKKALKQPFEGFRVLESVRLRVVSPIALG